MRDPGTGLSLTRRGPAGLVRGLVRDLDPDLADMRGRVDLAVRDRLDLGDRAVRDRVGLADPVDLQGRVDLAARDRLDPVGLVVRAGLVGLADMRGRLDLAVRDRRDRVGLVVRAGLADMRARVGPAVWEDLGGRDPVDRVDPVDLHRSRTHPGALTSGAAHRWAAPGMRRTASAHPTTVRRRRPHNTDSAGTVGLLPVRRRLSGMDRHPRVAGTVHRLPAVGTAHGLVRLAI